MKLDIEEIFKRNTKKYLENIFKHNNFNCKYILIFLLMYIPGGKKFIKTKKIIKMIEKTIYFYNGRLQWFHGIDLLKIKKIQVLLPEIICDVAVKVFLKKIKSKIL